MNGAGGPLCAEVVSRAQRDLLLLPGWGIAGAGQQLTFIALMCTPSSLKEKVKQTNHTGFPRA